MTLDLLRVAGDSNTGGYQGAYVPLADTYGARIGAGLGAAAIEVLGVSGEYPSGILNRLPQLCAGAPSRLIVMTGTNPAAASLDGAGQSVDEVTDAYRATMTAIIEGCTVPLTLFSAPASLSAAGNERLAAMAEALHDLCEAKGVHFFDVYRRTRSAQRRMSEAAFKALMYPADLDRWHWGTGWHARTADDFLRTQLGGGPAVPPPAGDGLIPQAYGTPIGNMTDGGGLAAAWDGNKVKAAAACARRIGSASPLLGGVVSMAGKAFPAPRMLRGVKFWASSDQGIANGGDVEVQLWRKSGPAPTSDTDGVPVWWTGIISDAPGLAVEKLDCAPAAADFAWVRVITHPNRIVTKSAAQVEFYEAAP